MRARPVSGEVGLALLFAAVGAVWIAGALGLPFWEGFAPQAGFLPFIYGVILASLSAAVLVELFRTENEAVDLQPTAKPLLVLAALTAAVVGVQAAGFGIAIFLFRLFLFAAVERLPFVRSLIVSAVTTALLIGVFRIWLGVPLPVGPFGI
jgi:putative tricarboxylic transport membrane protein